MPRSQHEPRRVMADDLSIPARAGIGSLSVVRSESVRFNARAVAMYAGTLDDADLRGSFLTAINTIQQQTFAFNRSESSLLLNFGYGPDLNEPALRELMASDSLPAEWQYGAQEMERIVVRIQHALQLIAATDPDLYTTLHLIVGTLFLARRKQFRSASISSLIGAIWLAPSAAWGPTTYAESIIHEYVHQCLFLDDMINGIFSQSPDAMAKNGLVTSAILRSRRSYDRSFHSAFVVFHLRQFYKRIGLPARESTFYKSLVVTVRELQDKRMFLTDHGNELLSELAVAI